MHLASVRAVVTRVLVLSTNRFNERHLRQAAGFSRREKIRLIFEVSTAWHPRGVVLKEVKRLVVVLEQRVGTPRGGVLPATGVPSPRDVLLAKLIADVDLIERLRRVN